MSKQAMDDAAKVAAKELLEMLDARDGTERGAYVVVNWLAKHYRAAGYRRLGRFLVNELLPRMDSGEF